MVKLKMRLVGVWHDLVLLLVKGNLANIQVYGNEDEISEMIGTDEDEFKILR